MDLQKTAYLSPSTGVLDITVIRDVRPYATITLDLGIPNFSIFTLKMPLVEERPQDMSALVAEAVHILLDEMSAFMLAMDYDEDVIVAMYALVLDTFKGMTKETDTNLNQSRAAQDPSIKTFEGTFQIPKIFINETLDKVVTAAQSIFTEAGIVAAQKDWNRFRYNSRRRQLDHTRADENASPEERKIAAKVLYEMQQVIFDRMLKRLSLVFGQSEDSVLGDDSLAYGRFAMTYALKARTAGIEMVGLGDYGAAVILQSSESGYITDMLQFIGGLVQKTKINEFFEQQKNSAIEYEERSKFGATKIKRTPDVTRIELTHTPPPKTTVNDVRRVIQRFRDRSLKNQPRPLYVVVYDQLGRPNGVLPINRTFKNQLLNTMKKGSATPQYTEAVKFMNTVEMRSTNIKGIPQNIFLGEQQFTPQAYCGDDMALYQGEGYLVKFPDGHCKTFATAPSLKQLKERNYPVPENYSHWRVIEAQEQTNPNESMVTSDGQEVNPGQAGHMSEDKPATLKRAAKQECFHDAFRALLYGAPNLPDLSQMDSVQLVHGYVELDKGDGTTAPGPHGWLEFSSGKYQFVWEPQSKRVINKRDFYEAVRPQVIAKYDETEASKQAVTSKHSGPWHSYFDDHDQMSKRADHFDANGFWAGDGGAASGILPICPKTKRICLAWRSADVNQGECWGTIGGAVQKDMSPEQSAKEEFKEEVGYTGGITLYPAYVFSSGSFKYYNFIGEVPTEFGFHPHSGHSWETDEISWFTYEELVEDMANYPAEYHSGVHALFHNSGDLIRRLCGVSQ